MRSQIQDYLTLAGEVFAIASSSRSAEAKYDLIFSERLSMPLTILLPLHYADPDTSYEEDVAAYVSALREQYNAIKQVHEAPRCRITDAQIRLLFAQHCECRPLNTARIPHSHDCEDDVTEACRIALHGFIVECSIKTVAVDEDKHEDARQFLAEQLHKEQ